MTQTERKAAAAQAAAAQAREDAAALTRRLSTPVGREIVQNRLNDTKEVA